ncbi:AraC family transcriptional regulator [Nocardia acididurans]|nr:AraC family transcriptional regulator [Nocardia acididurans]
MSAGHALYAGPALDLEPHSGSVWCFAVGVDHPFTIRLGDADRFDTTTALIPPRTTHQLIAHGGRMIFAYLDPSSHRAQACRELMTDRTRAVGVGHTADQRLRELGATLLAATAAEIPIDGARSATETLGIAWLDLAAPALQQVMDARITEAVKIIHNDPAATVPAGELAAQAGLSESRFLHLFRQEAGTSLRRYRQWARLLHTATVFLAGHDLTRAATEAGFASPSHFADRFRITFGLSATRLLGSGARLRLLDQERN